MSIVGGKPSSSQNRFAHGPGAITSCSPTATEPFSVTTRVTESSAANSSSRTSTSEQIVTPSDSHFPTRPCTEARLKAKPPWSSWRQTVTPFARQSGNSDFMCSSTSLAPTISSER